MANKYIQLKDNSGNQLYPRTDWSVILNIPTIPTVASVNAKQDALTSANAGTNITITTVNGVTKINAPDMSSYTSLSNKPSINGVTLSGALTAANLNLPWCMTTSNGDLEIADPNGNVILRLSNGHIKTKEFDSSEKLLSLSQLINDVGYVTSSYHDPTKVNSVDLVNLLKAEKFVQYSTANSFSILDGSGNAVLSVSSGYISTTNFNSSSVLTRLSAVESSKQNVLTSANAGNNVTITTVDGVIKINATGGGGGGGGTSDYNDLASRPLINGVVITGSQTPNYYGLVGFSTTSSYTSFLNGSNTEALKIANGYDYIFEATTTSSPYVISSQVNNNSTGYIATFDGGTSITAGIDASSVELVNNRVIAIGSGSLDTEYPSAKCVYDELVLRNNQNAFSSVSIEDGGTVSATSATDGITFISDGDIVLSADSVNKAIVFELGGGVVPSGGTTGQALCKASNSDYDYIWATVSGGSGNVPSGGTAGQALIKSSSVDYDAAWTNIYQIPSGGTTGQALCKSSGSDFVVQWSDTYSPYVFTATYNSTTNQIELDNSKTINDIVTAWNNGNNDVYILYNNARYRVTLISSIIANYYSIYTSADAQITMVVDDFSVRYLYALNVLGTSNVLKMNTTSVRTRVTFSATLSGTTVTLSSSKTVNDVYSACSYHDVYISVDSTYYRISKYTKPTTSTITMSSEAVYINDGSSRLKAVYVKDVATTATTFTLYTKTL